MQNLPTQRIGFAALSPQQQEAHRLKIGVRAQAILSQFWRDDETPDAIQALEIEGWCDVLENCSHSEIREAWAAYQKTGPRSKAGKLYKPDAGALYRIIMAARPKPQVVVRSEPELQRVPCSPEVAAEIVARAGFQPKRMNAGGDELPW